MPRSGTLLPQAYERCNAASLAVNLARMPQFLPQQARQLDTFPHTEHADVAVLLARIAAPG